MLEAKRRSGEQDCNQGNLSEVESALYGFRGIFALLPQPSDVGCGSSGVAADEISWTDGAGDVGTFWEMLALLTGGKDAAVATRSWSTPGRYFALLSSYGKSPTSVDELYGTPADSVFPEHIDDSYELFLDLNPRKPKEQQRHRAKKRHAGQRRQGISQPVAHQDYQPRKDHDCDAGHRNSSSGAGSEYLHAKSLACNEEVLS